MQENNSRETAKKERKKMPPTLSFILTIVIVIAVVVLINRFVVVNAIIPTGSMEQTIMANERVIGFRIVYLFTEPKRGDIVVFHNPDDPSELYVKRIVGMPGETLEVKDGVTYINGHELEEPYINESYGTHINLEEEDYGPYEIPEDGYFMMGDNRGNSKDARFWNNTYITKKDMVGNVFWRYWPANKTGIIK